MRLKTIISCKHLVLLVTLSVFTGCLGPQSKPEPKPASAQTTSSDKQPNESQPAADSRYAVGDYVIYRYSGTFSKEPVALREEVIGKDDLELTLQVTATRGEETRRWIQVVVDTVENRNNDRVKALYEIVDGERVELENEGNRDLYRLYEWTIPPCSGKPSNPRKLEKKVTIGQERYQCMCQVATQTCQQRPARLESCDCLEFLWTHAISSAIDEKTGQEVWKVEVVETGRVP